MDLLNAMRVFVRVVELGSFSAAAADLGVRTSAASRAVASLEADLGAALFHRTTRRVHLTEPGAGFYEQARKVLRDVEDARRTALGMDLKPQGTLRVQAPAAFGRLHVAPHIPDFLAAYPDIRLDIAFTDVRVDLISVGADVAIRIGPMLDSSLIARKLAPHRRVVCASPAYLERQPAIRAPQDLAEHDCLIYSLQPTPAWFFEPAKGGERQAITVCGAIRADDSEPLRDLAVAGLGVVLLPTWLVGDDIRAGRLVRVLPEWTSMIATQPSGIFGLYPPPHHAPTQKVKAFLDFLHARFGRQPYWEVEG
ncbi:MAG: LysR family transcriptional regulator [Caulobacteraceae bacterium]